MVDALRCLIQRCRAHKGYLRLLCLSVGVTSLIPLAAYLVPVQTGFGEPTRLIDKSGPPLSELEWSILCADCPKDLFNIGDQSLALDSSGLPHIVYVGDYVYYAWHNGLSWQTEVVDESPDPVYVFYQAPASIALDTTNTPHVAFLDATNRAIRYAYRSTDGWIISTVDEAAPGQVIVYETSLALDSEDRPHISYSDYGELKHAHWDGDNWQIEIIDDSGWSEMYISLALDNEDRPHISYFYLNNGRASISYAHRSETGWRIDRIDSATWLGEHNSLSLDGEGKPHISYLDVTNKQIKYAHLTDAGWEIQIIDSSEWPGGFTAIATDQENNPHISYTTAEDELRYAVWTGTTWAISHVDNSSAWHISLALDDATTPQIVYFRWHSQQLMMATITGDDWLMEEIDSISKVGRYTSLVLDESGNPHISYTEYVSGKLQYAYRSKSGWLIESIDDIGVDGGHTSLELTSTTYPVIGYYDAIHGDLKVAWWNDDKWLIERVDSDGDVGQYISLAVDAADDPHISYYDVTNGDLKYARKVDGLWQMQTVDDIGDVGAYSTLALDWSGNPHIAFHDSINGDLLYTYWTGSAWQKELIDEEGIVGTYASIALDTGGDVHVSYSDLSGRSLKYARRTAEGWRTETVFSIGNDEGVIRHTSLVLDSHGNPHIGYYHDSAGLRYSWHNGKVWETTEPISSLWVGDYVSLALDSQDRPFITFHDSSYHDLKYAVSLQERLLLPAIRK